jgi:ribosome maturation factor RimP
VVRGCLKIWFTSLGGPPRPAHFSFWDLEQKLTHATEQLVHALEPLIDPICRAHGVELVDVRCLREPAGMVIRVIIDREVPGVEVGSGVSLEDCTGVSRDVSTALDVHDDVLPSGAFRLEVSSPGLERPLVKLADFERFSGREVKVRTQTPIERQRHFRGKLLRVVDQSIELDQDGKVLLIPHADIAQANLVYRFSN